MTAISLPLQRPNGRALVIGAAPCRADSMRVLDRAGYQSNEADDPYAAMAELCARPLAYRAMVLSLSSTYRAELQLIGAVKRRFPHVEIWLAQTDGRAAALAEATQLGADGLLSDEGLHRFSATSAALGTESPPAVRVAPPPPSPADIPEDPDASAPAPGEAVLTAEELRALLQEPKPGEP